MPAPAQFIVVWRFKVAPEKCAEFEQIYGPGGAWKKLFALDAAHLETELLRGAVPGVYLTVDRWASRDAFLAFRERHAAAYAALDRQGVDLTEEEQKLGEFEQAR